MSMPGEVAGTVSLLVARESPIIARRHFWALVFVYCGGSEEELYPRKWNHSFIDLPRIRNPKQSFFTGAVVTRTVVDAKKEKYKLLFALCGGTGLRFGETLGIRIQDISPDCSTIKILRKAWPSQLRNFLKTDSSFREVNLCHALAAILKKYLDKRRKTLKSNLLFQCRSDKPLHQSNILQRTLQKISMSRSMAVMPSNVSALRIQEGMAFPRT